MSGMVYVANNRRLVQLFPDNVRKVWGECELRVLILFSLFLQTLLIYLGPRRKYTSRVWIRISIWLAYLMADWVATVALGVISQNIQENCKCDPHRSGDPHLSSDQLNAFWAPFLILHLGGPDSITAYSLEDNELWLRHLLGLLVQVSVALYILLMAWPGPLLLSWLTLFMLAAGLIKYGERTYALRMANSEQLRSSMLTPADSGPNYPKFMEEFSLKKAEGFYVKADEVIEAHVAPHHHPIAADRDDSGPAGVEKPDDVLLLRAYDQFQKFRKLFVDLILSFQDKDDSRSFFQSLRPRDAFHVVELELGFAYDVLYTKTPVVYTRNGCVLRCVSFLFTFSVLLVFAAMSEKTSHYLIADVIITYSLLVVAILLEFYAVVVLLDSDWTKYYWRRPRQRQRRISPPKWLLFRHSNKQWWSNSMAQYNLLTFCLQPKPALCPRFQKLFGVHEIIEHHRHREFVEVSPKLKSLIFKRFKDASDGKDLNDLCKFRGGGVLGEDNRSFEWSTKVEFDQSILIWHIVTDLCYYHQDEDGIRVRVENPAGNNSNGDDDDDDDDGDDGEMESNRRESKRMSDYMLYLLVMCPFTLPIGFGMIRFLDTCREAKEFLSETKDPREGCRKLMEVNTEVLPIKVKGDRSKTVLFDACRVAAELKKMERREMWRMLSAAWVEMLAYAATHCRGNQHAQLLRKGGELLTHVWLLMAHLGITQQFQIFQGHARARLRAR